MSGNAVWLLNAKLLMHLVLIY